MKTITKLCILINSGIYNNVSSVCVSVHTSWQLQSLQLFLQKGELTVMYYSVTFKFQQRVVNVLYSVLYENNYNSCT